MTPTLEEVETAALKLPEKDLAVLTQKLLSKLYGAEPELDARWIAEIERRWQQFEDGKVKTIPADAVFARAFERLNARG